MSLPLPDLRSLALLVLVAGACGTIPSLTDGGSTSSSDASPKDAGVPDANTEPGPVTVEVKTREGNPVANIQVALNNAEGDAIGKPQMTDPNGRTTFVDVEPGSMVTVFFIRQDTQIPRYDAFTVLEVQPGSTLVFQTGGDNSTTSPSSATILLPQEALAGISRFEVDLGPGCTRTLSPNDIAQKLEMSINDKCYTSSRTLNALVTAWDNSQLVAAASGKGYSPGPGASSVSIDLSRMPWNKSPGKLTVTATHVPQPNVNVFADLSLAANQVTYFENSEPSSSTGNDEVRFVFAYPPAFADELFAELTLGYMGATGSVEAMSRYTTSLPTTSMSLDLDANTMLLPRIRNIKLMPGVLADGRPQVTWEIDAASSAIDATTADGTVVGMFWGGSGGESSHSWFAIAPPTLGGSFRFPAIPTSLADWKPMLTDVPKAGVGMVEAKAFDGYPGFRAQFNLLFSDGNQGLLGEAALTLAGAFLEK